MAAGFLNVKAIHPVSKKKRSGDCFCQAEICRLVDLQCGVVYDSIP